MHHIGSSYSPVPPWSMRFLIYGLLVATTQAQDFVNFETPQVHPLDISPDASTLAVCNTADHRIEIFDLSSGIPEASASIPVGADPVTARFVSDTQLWVVNQLSDSVSVIDLPTKTITHTLFTGDEPADVIFTSTHAVVSCSQENTLLLFDLADLPSVPETVPLLGEEPRALALSSSGEILATFFESGNNTTLLGGGAESGSVLNFPPNAVSDPAGPYGGTNPPPNRDTVFVPAQNSRNPSPPAVGLIIRKSSENTWLDDNARDWTPLVSGALAPRSGRIVGWDMLDHDVAVIGEAATSFVGSLMNIVAAIAVNPATGLVTVVGTDATNEIRFEPNINGTFLRVLGATFDPASPETAPTIFDLNPHLDYSTSTISQIQREQSIGDPRGIAWDAAGTTAYITGMGSNNVVAISPTGTRTALIETGEGPTGIVYDVTRSQLYVLNRFDASISVINSESNAETARIPYFDPTPEVIKAGRKFLYDTHLTSGLGHVSCASCHVDARTDRLAWDLGDPSGSMIGVDGSTHNLGGGIIGLTSNFTDFHPMKGPMTTQTFQDIIGKEPHHWRGDRSGIEEFNDSFTKLLGDDQQLSPDQMQMFEDYLATIVIPPNPFRNLDNSLPTDLPLPGHVTGARFGEAGQPMPNGNAQRGLDDLYRPISRGIDRGSLACVTCHTLPTGMGTGSSLSGISFSGIDFTEIPPGPDGERHHAVVSSDGSTQRTIKIPQLRTLYDKHGLDFTSKNSLTGFGLLHDGSIDGLSRFLSEDAFEIEDNQELADLVALMLAFSGSEFGDDGDFFEPPGTASFDSHAAVGQQVTLSAAGTTPRLDVFLALARERKIDLIARTPDGRGYRHLEADTFLADASGETATTSALAQPGTTFTCLVRGTGGRYALDRDRDGLRDHDESRDLAPDITGHQNPFLQAGADTTGDNGSIVPDGIPDAQNDFDGDGQTNIEEFEAGTNPADNLSVEVPLALVAEASDNLITLTWETAPLATYEIQSSDDLIIWQKESEHQSGINPATEESIIPLGNARKFYRALRFR